MRRERRKPTRAEWREITTPGLVVRKVLDRPQSTRPEPNNPTQTRGA
jgi:hypothetical protein